MGKSQETFGKKEKEKKRLKLRQEKQEKMDERKANAKKGKSLDEMMAYLEDPQILEHTQSQIIPSFLNQAINALQEA